MYNLLMARFAYVSDIIQISFINPLEATVSYALHVLCVNMCRLDYDRYHVLTFQLNRIRPIKKTIQ